MVQYRAPGRPRSSRWIRWKGCSILYNLEVSTMSGTYQEGMFLPFKGYMIKTQKRSNTEPHGVPEALDRFVGKVIEFSTIWKRRECLEPTKRACFLALKAT